MRVAIIGTGNMARAIGARVLAGGHELEFIGTHISKAKELADEMVGEGSVGAAEEVDADIVILAVPYTEAPTWCVSTPVACLTRSSSIPPIPLTSASSSLSTVTGSGRSAQAVN
jgi:3-hydroxyisobutyrate dehydrogenase-like beta-hydroxyacid dehydrogenase